MMYILDGQFTVARQIPNAQYIEGVDVIKASDTDDGPPFFIRESSFISTYFGVSIIFYKELPDTLRDVITTMLRLEIYQPENKGILPVAYAEAEERLHIRDALKTRRVKGLLDVNKDLTIYWHLNTRRPFDPKEGHKYSDCISRLMTPAMLSLLYGEESC